MTVQWLLAWWNLIYMVPFALALTYLFAYAGSGWTFGEFDADAEADVDADADLHADVEFHADAAAHGGGRAGIDADSEAAGEPQGLLHLLSWLGVGRVPLSIILMVLLLTWGVVGFGTNQALRGAMGTLVWLASIPLAAVVSLALTAAVSNALARLLPVAEGGALRRQQLVGRRGTVIFAVTEESGLVGVRDDDGDRYQLAARILPGGEAVPPGEEIVLVRYEPDRSLFLVRASGL